MSDDKKQPSDPVLQNERAETRSDAFDLAIQEAVRETTPKRRAIKLAKKRHERLKPPLTIEQILVWADAYHEQHGKWPKGTSGPVMGVSGETWTGIELALYRGNRGLPGNTTLPRLLTTHRGAPYFRSMERGKFAPLYCPKPPVDPEFFTIPQILARVDAWHLQYDKWPNADSGPVSEGSPITWSSVESALRVGSYRLPGGCSLARLLESERGVRNKRDLPSLTPEQILEWADLYKERTDQWPTKASGVILEAPGETWAGVDAALYNAGRGLPGRSSLTILLEEERDRRNCKRLPPLTTTQILEWADNHHTQTGTWPHYDSGLILDAPEESWASINHSLFSGNRSLPGGSSLASLLMDSRGIRNRKRLSHLNKEQILLWADAYKEQHGKWPLSNSGPIAGTRGETWTAISLALSRGQRGLPGDTTLPRLLAEFRGAPYNHDPEDFSISQILDWADTWYLRHGTWPQANSGPIAEETAVTWNAIHSALANGRRGLPGGSSLARLLAAERDVRNRLVMPPFTREQILKWADLYKERTGRWPTKGSGIIPEAAGEKWAIVDDALRHGRGGLSKGSSLAILLAEERGRRNNTHTPPLTEPQILQWADSYYAQTGKWPTHKSGPIADVPDETWSKVNNALSVGGRSLVGGSSLYKLLIAQRGVQRNTA